LLRFYRQFLRGETKKCFEEDWMKKDAFLANLHSIACQLKE